jgi:hypothetical protein
VNFDTQTLINTGQAWRMEGAIGRQCDAALDLGYAILGPRERIDYWGNVVPSRYQVKPGTKGSVQYANLMRKARGDRPLRGIDFDNGRAYDEYLDEIAWMAEED